MDSIKTIEHKGYKINIYPDDTINESPREWDNLGVMVCFHGRHTLGDKTKLTSDMFDSWEELYKYLVEEGAVLISPLYMYDHSGIHIKIGNFYGCGLPQGHAHFDSGQIGFTYTTRKKILECCGSYKDGKCSSKRVSKVMLEKAKQVLTAEVETYDQYCAGDVYGYMIEDPEGNEKGGCWGYYGYDFEKSDLLPSAKGEINCEIKNKLEEHNKKLKAQIKGNAPLEIREAISA